MEEAAKTIQAFSDLNQSLHDLKHAIQDYQETIQLAQKKLRSVVEIMTESVSDYE